LLAYTFAMMKAAARAKRKVAELVRSFGSAAEAISVTAPIVAAPREPDEAVSLQRLQRVTQRSSIHHQSFRERAQRGTRTPRNLGEDSVLTGR